MKKFTGLVAILFVISLLAAGCSGGGGGSNVTEPEDQKKVTETKPKPKAKVVKEETKRPPKPSTTKGTKTEPEVTAKPGGEEVKALETVYYEYDKSRITKDAADTLKANAEVMVTDAALRVRIEGHCDERGTKEYNQALGERRANSAMQYLKNLGVGLDRMETISYGEERPAVAGTGEDVWAENRRSEFKRIK